MIPRTFFRPLPLALKILAPKFLTIKNILVHQTWGYRVLVVGGSSFVLLWLPISIYFFVLDGLHSITNPRQVEGVMELIITTFTSIFFIAACIHALQVFFLAKENELYLIAPIPQGQFFLAKFLENCFAAAWILLLLFLPMLWAVGVIAHASSLFFIVSPLYLFCIIIGLSAVAIGFVILMARIYPARRLRELFIIGALLTVGLLHLYTRSAEIVLPHVDNGSIQAFEQTVSIWKNRLLVRSQDFLSLPIRMSLGNNRLRIFELFLAFSIIARFMYLAAFRIFCDFYEPSELIERWQQAKKPKRRFWFRTPPHRLYAMIQKDLHLFLRDLAQPAQLILFVAIAGITLVSYRQTAQLKLSLSGSELVFSDILFGLGIFTHLMMTVLFAGRFIFPALSYEAESRWLLDSSPIPPSELIRIKFLTQAILSLVILLPIYWTLACITDLPLNRIIIGTVITATSIVGVVSIAIGSGSFLKLLGGDPLASSISAMGSFIFMTVSLFLIPTCMAASLAAAVLYSASFTDLPGSAGLIYCIAYAIIIRFLGAFFLSRASRLW